MSRQAGVLIVLMIAGALGGCAPGLSDEPSATTSAANTLPTTTLTDPVIQDEADPMTDSTLGTSTDAPTTTDPVEPIRYITPDEWAQVQSDCLLQRGFVVTLTRDGGMLFSPVPEEQQPALNEAVRQCAELYPVDPIYERPLAPDQLQVLYDWYVDTSIPCLRTLGYDGFEPPSLGAFQETYESGPWVPYQDIEASLDMLSPDEWYDLQETCPQSPPLELLYEG